MKEFNVMKELKEWGNELSENDLPEVAMANNEKARTFLRSYLEKHFQIRPDTLMKLYSVSSFNAKYIFMTEISDWVDEVLGFKSETATADTVTESEN